MPTEILSRKCTQIIKRIIAHYEARVAPSIVFPLQNEILSFENETLFQNNSHYKC